MSVYKHACVYVHARAHALAYMCASHTASPHLPDRVMQILRVLLCWLAFYKQRGEITNPGHMVYYLVIKICI